MGGNDEAGRSFFHGWWQQPKLSRPIGPNRNKQEREEELDSRYDQLTINLCLRGSWGKGFFDHPPEPANKYSKG